MSRKLGFRLIHRHDRGWAQLWNRTCIFWTIAERFKKLECSPGIQLGRLTEWDVHIALVPSVPGTIILYWQLGYVAQYSLPSDRANYARLSTQEAKFPEAVTARVEPEDLYPSMRYCRPSLLRRRDLLACCRGNRVKPSLALSCDSDGHGRGCVGTSLRMYGPVPRPTVAAPSRLAQPCLFTCTAVKDNAETADVEAVAELQPGIIRSRRTWTGTNGNSEKEGDKIRFSFVPAASTLFFAVFLLSAAPLLATVTQPASEEMCIYVCNGNPRWIWGVTQDRPQTEWICFSLLGRLGETKRDVAELELDVHPPKNTHPVCQWDTGGCPNGDVMPDRHGNRTGDDLKSIIARSRLGNRGHSTNDAIPMHTGSVRGINPDLGYTHYYEFLSGESSYVNGRGSLRSGDVGQCLVGWMEHTTPSISGRVQADRSGPVAAPGPLFSVL
ncbi:hypothetical protein OE88DRAFT_1642688 [Heliocybe sulcata]|uniref:Uncharacterized protein n=1 Tax=Heliocybe sulcata TaxID=5364 RepID=A0A5C3NDG6_9AGAM|nr:hypothetical protein OE88DRAFT_1642688 [Heliocybe sulcata]